MPGKSTFFAISLFCILYSCSDKEMPVVEKKFTTIELNAFTVDPYRFRVSMNDDEVVTDSLLTPEGRVAKEVFFDSYSHRIKVFNTSDERLLIDTPYTLRIGKANVFTVYQTQANTPPFYLAPAPGELLPAAGNGKFSIIYSGTELPDSAKVLVETQNAGIFIPADSVILKRNAFSRYFEVMATRNMRIRFYETPGNRLVGENVFGPGSLSAAFTIYRLTKQGGSTLIAQQLY